jgi:DNA replication and repair protein RecF
VIAERLTTRSFRNLEDAGVRFGPGLTVIAGPNGAGKTNHLEALYFALTGRSCRTRREREMIAFGADVCRAEARLAPEEGEPEDPIEMRSSVSRSEGRRRVVDGRPAEPDDDRRRPAVSIFMPDRLALVKGGPRSRRAHLDRLVAALWPARAELAADYTRALVQRNALIARIRKGGGGEAQLASWDAALAARAVPLVEARALAGDELAGPFADTAAALGLDGGAELRYRPSTGDLDEAGITAELESRRRSDLDRGYTLWGPHRDEVELSHAGRALRRYGSQGQQRLGLLSLLIAERAALREARRTLPLMLLDDVMSELDPGRRRSLVETVGTSGQVLITATEAEHVPDVVPRTVLEVADGAVRGGGDASG